MKHKAQYTTPQLKRRQLKGEDVVPVFGRYEGMPPLRHLPRNKFDPKPWATSVDGFRYSAWELTTEKHVPTPGELAELRHEVEDTTDFIRANMACAGSPQVPAGAVA